MYLLIKIWCILQKKYSWANVTFTFLFFCKLRKYSCSDSAFNKHDDYKVLISRIYNEKIPSSYQSAINMNKGKHYFILIIFNNVNCVQLKRTIIRDFVG